MSLIAAEALRVDLGGRRVLMDINLSIEPQEIVTVVGPNGSGKSTLARALIGAIPITSGRLTRQPDLRVGYMPQKLHIDPSLPLTVARFLNLPGGTSERAVAEALERVELADLTKRQMAELSGGQFQRVMLARALLSQPHLLVLDEASQGLDQPASARFYTMIDETRRDLGCAVLMISHDLHVVMSATDRVICLNGHICCEGAPEVVTNAPEYQRLFGAGTAGALALYRHHHDHAHDLGVPMDKDQVG
ncbi:MAG: ATP-binding cassette domain-containing protein [Pseudomonadota bacterium]